MLKEAVWGFATRQNAKIQNNFSEQKQTFFSFPRFFTLFPAFRPRNGHIKHKYQCNFQ
jgi:hypothetical protein